MKKYRSIIIVCIILILGGVAFFILRDQKPVIRNGLSERSKEYLKDRKANKDSSLQYAAIEDEKTKTLLNKTEVTVGNCFRLFIPFKVWNERKEGDCSMYYAIDNPRGQVVVYQEKAQVESFDSVPGVSMRRQFPDTYAEETKVINGKTFLLFQRKQEAYEKNAFYYDQAGYFVLNILSTSSENLDGKLEEMLKTLTFL